MGGVGAGVGVDVGVGVRVRVVVGVGSAVTAGWLRERGVPVGEVAPGDGEPAGLVRGVVEAALGAVDAAERERIAVVLAAAEPCAHAATRYAVRWADTTRRLRPSDSTSLETTELVRGLAAGLGWRGPLYVVATPGTAGAQALLLAGALARGGRRVVVAELLRAPGGRTRPPAPARPGRPPAAPEPEWLAAAALWPPPWGLPAEPPTAAGSGLPGALLALAAREAEPVPPTLEEVR